MVDDGENTQRREPVDPIVWHFEDIVRRGLAALAAGGDSEHPMIEDRIVAVRATPERGTSRHMAAGVSVIPAGYSTPPHSHLAEEYAHVLSGDGVITIDGVGHPVARGDILLTPDQSVHVTTAGREPLAIWWIYGPAGSEGRWLGAVSGD
ncbi:MAG: cupin domain-containing protein [Microbacterium sp.]